MRLLRLDLLRYGRFTDRSLELSAKGADFHIIFGPNEAGKSTALAAIEDFLFGIPTRSPYDFLHDYASMRIGAVLENGGSSLNVIRRKGKRDTLLRTDGFPVSGGEGALRPYLAGAVVAIGNAPTALFRLLEGLADGAPRPAVIIASFISFSAVNPRRVWSCEMWYSTSAKWLVAFAAK